MPPSFEYCALHFWDQWHGYEARLYAAISARPTALDVRAALNYFQVARTFAGIAAEGAADHIRDCLIRVRNDASLPMPHQKVENLADELSARFSQRNISAASKLLWLSFREHFVIFDSRADNALHMHFEKQFDDYQSFTVAWHQVFELHKEEITQAVQRLPSGRVFMRLPASSEAEILTTAMQPWFMERIFDIFLWEVSGEL